MTAGQRVQVIEVAPRFDRTHRLTGTTGTVIRVQPRYWAPYVVALDDGRIWAFGGRSLQPIGDDA